MARKKGEERYAARRARLLREAEPLGLDGCLVSDMPNLRYYTGFSGSSGYAFITPGSCRLVTDGRYRLQAAREAPGCEVAVWESDLFRFLGEQAKDLGLRRLGYEPEAVTAHFLSSWRKRAGKGLRLAAAPGLAAKPRRLKEREEVGLLRRAARLSEASITAVLETLRSSNDDSWSESRFAAELEAEMRGRGAEDRSFPTIALEGTRGALPHGKPSGKRLRNGRALLVDWGAVYRGYHADLTRTLLPGNADARLMKAMDAVLRARERVLREIRPGVKAAELDRLARSVLEEAGMGRFIAHSLGHGVGLETHEAPHLSPRSPELLEEGMVFTVEPGLYLPGVGGVRVEDMVWLAPGGPRLLSSLPPQMPI
jgi:Xaa-Pro aminopeptidase